MNGDRRLIDFIKVTFAGKSLAQLQEIAAATDRDRWSAEAMAAAGEVLTDRRDGRTREPLVPDEADESPVTSLNTGMLALGVLGGVLTGDLFLPIVRTGESADPPVPFGHDVAWLCVRTTDTAAVTQAMGLYEVREATWVNGIEAAHGGAVYVTPPVSEWTFAVGTALFQLPGQTAAEVTAILGRLSREFGEAQYFAHHVGVGLSVWARATEGRLERAYGWLGAQDTTIWEEGVPTDEEDGLGFRFVAGQPPRVETDTPGELVPFPDDGVHQLAACWSFDPTILGNDFKEPGSGRLGTLTPIARSPWRSPR